MLAFYLKIAFLENEFTDLCTAMIISIMIVLYNIKFKMRPLVPIYNAAKKI